MLKKIISMAFVWLFFSSATAQVIPNSYIEGLGQSSDINKIIKLNSSMKISQFKLCDSYVYDLEECLAVSDGEMYLVDLKKGSIYRINDKKLKRIKKGQLAKLGSIIVKYFNEKLEAAQKVKTQSGLNFTTQNSSTFSRDWCSSSPELFPFSCQRHDFCYESGSPKEACDTAFRINMELEIEHIRDSDIEAWVTLFTASRIYYQAVVHTDKAFESFCGGTPNPESFAICENEDLWDNLEDHTDTDNGQFTGIVEEGAHPRVYEDPISGQGLNYSCELWQFPDGNGGVYLMYRNCIYS